MLRVGKANGCFKTKDGSILVLQNFVCKQRKLYLVGCKFRCLEDFYEYPLPSSELGIFRVSLTQLHSHSRLDGLLMRKKNV